MREAIKGFDFTIVEGHRGRVKQDAAFEAGNSKVRWPNSKHNKLPSEAVDIAPWQPEEPHIDWLNTKRFILLGGYVLGIVRFMNTVRENEGLAPIKIRWGGDWDRDTFMKDQTFNDLPHFEVLVT